MKKLLGVILSVLLFNGVAFADMQYLSNGTNLGVATKVNVVGATTTRSGQTVTINTLTPTGNQVVTGNLTVSGTSTLTGAVSAAAVINANGGVDRSTAAALAIGATNATSVVITPATTVTGAVIHSSTSNLQAATTATTINFAADAQSTDTYVITLAPVPAAYVTGMMITFTANTANTGACSVNVNGLGAKALKKGVSTDPGDNFIKVGSVVVAVYDGTNFQMLQPAAQ